MKKKLQRFLSGLLAVSMFFTSSITLTKAIEDATEIGTTTEGTYLDSSAVAEEGYVYEVVGSDGSVATVEVDAVDDTTEDDSSSTVETITTKPSISWTRTQDDTTNPVRGLSFVNTDGSVTSNGVTYDKFTALTWEWSSLEKLILDQETKQSNVWDYENSLGISAADFNDNNNSWTASDVHKISGTFVWPEGYDLNETTITLQSVNDSKYTAIYDYISNNGLSDLYGSGKVFPVNDDVYVVMWVEDGTTLDTNNTLDDTTDDTYHLTVDNISNYLLFWTGTSGKGIWSHNGISSNDWARTTPATLLSASKQGVRAFYGAWPNAIGVDTTLSNSNVVNMDTSSDIYSYLHQSDCWYTLTDTTAINSVMRNNYPNGITDGSKVHLDLYCFNNSEGGGIDELEIVLSKQQETETSVEVQYYYGQVTDTTDTTHYLGSSILTNQEYGTSISLTSGTKASQLNYMKAAAIVKAGNKKVTDGTQTNNPLVVTRGADNIIYVVYTATTSDVVYLTAATGTYAYDGNEHALSDITITQKGLTGTATSLGNGSYTLPDGNTLYNVYSTVSATLPGKYTNNFNESNGSTESFVVKDSDGNIVTNNYTFITTPGTLTITYDPENVSYVYDFGLENIYSSVLNEIELNATISETSDKLSYSENSIIYKPTTVNTGEDINLTLTFAGNYQVTKKITLKPASTVLYEEDYINVPDDGYWALDGEALTNKVTDNNTTVYGYTNVYENNQTLSNGSAYKTTLELNANTARTKNAMTFTFTGTGFDLISECGSNTGMLVVRVDDANGNAKKAFIVDTYFAGDSTEDSDGNSNSIISNGTTVYQIPVVRELGLDYGTYTVNVFGYLISTAGSVNTVAMDLDDTSSSSLTKDELVDIILMDLEMYDIDSSIVDVSYLDENSVFNGGTGTVEANSNVGLMLLSDDTDSTTTTVPSADIYVDGFRIYNPLQDTTVYVENEQNVTYKSVYDFIANSTLDLISAGTVSNAFVYIEYDGEKDQSVLKTYQIQGPQNEVYLTKGSSIAFVLDGYESGDTVHLGAKYATAGAKLNDTEVTDTEMYYDITESIEYDENLGYYVVITNTGTGVLSISGLKTTIGITPLASAELGDLVVAYLTEKGEFNPSYLKVSYYNSIFAKRNFYVNVVSSTDVAKVVIKNSNEEVIAEITPTNSFIAKLLKLDYYTFTKSIRETSSGTYTYKVYAVNDEGVYSAPIEISVTVR